MPRSDAQSEDDGWVLSMVYRASSNTTDLAILDAQNLSRGPVALIHLPQHIPHGDFPSLKGRPALTTSGTDCMGAN